MRVAHLRGIAFTSLAALAGACTPPVPETLSLVPPAKLRQTDGLVAQLTAEAELVPDGGEPGEPQALDEADGVFSGFLAASPGDYTLEVRFRGEPQLPAPYGESIFLGRWASDPFTVVQGDVASPTFTRTLDTVGRPGDGGDDDGDALGLFDEILWGTEPDAADSDGDGLDDGDDCFPNDGVASIAIASTGGIDDCDGDGATRGDRNFRGDVTDCNDLDSAVNPFIVEAASQCGDTVDQDCNDDTCPGDSGASISDVSPPSGSTLGCYASIEATVTGDNVEFVFLYWNDLTFASSDAFVNMNAVGGGRYRSQPVATVFLRLQAGFVLPTQSLEIQAQDQTGITSVLPLTYSFEFRDPTLTATPATIASVAQPFDIHVTATIPGSSAITVSLHRIAKAGTGKYFNGDSVLVETKSGADVTFTVDMSALADGDYLLYPTITDEIGNSVDPADNLVGEVTPYDGLLPLGQKSAQVNWSCTETQLLWSPVYEVHKGVAAQTKHRMQDLIAEATTRATTLLSGVVLNRIDGYAVLPDGTVDLSAGLVSSWRFHFHDPVTDDTVTVSWTPTSRGPPEIASPGFGGTGPALSATATLAGSDDVATAFAGTAGCPVLAGRSDDLMTYSNDGSRTVVDVLVGSASKFWRAPNDTLVPDPGWGCP